MSAPWVDFRHVRESVDFGGVLEAYGVTLKLRGDQHHGFCPLPGHDGRRRSPSFSANLAKRAFHCFGCQAGGNAIDFVALMEGLDPDDPRDVRQAALLIQERFLHEAASPPTRSRAGPGAGHNAGREATEMQSGRSPPRAGKTTTRQRQHKRRPPDRQPTGRQHQRDRPERDQSNGPHASEAETNPRTSLSDSRGDPVEGPLPDPLSDEFSDGGNGSCADRQPDNRPRVVNAPLDFELKGLDPDHPYLQQRGLTPETIRTFGLGYCGRGMMAGRIAIPLHDHEGNLIGYAGRVTDDSLIGPENPKYRLPGARERDGTVFEFRKGAFLFNGHRVLAPATDLIVVEGFFSVFHLHQCGRTNAVALMGSSCSPEQADLIVRLTPVCGRVWLMPDGDEAGERCAEDVLMRIAPRCLIRWTMPEPGKSADDYPCEDLTRILSDAGYPV